MIIENLKAGLDQLSSYGTYLKEKNRFDALDEALAYDQRVSYVGRLDAINSVVGRLCAPRFSHGMILLTEWGTWPSSEDNFLYYLLRRQAGAFDHIKDRPTHIFQNFEEQEFRSLLRLSMINGWGGAVIVGGVAVATFSHNEYIDIASYEEMDFKVLRD